MYQIRFHLSSQRTSSIWFNPRKIESCRAMGNMCYENGLQILFISLHYFLSPLANGCELVYHQIGINILFDLCRYACQTMATEAAQLRMITLGALHNIINSNGNKMNFEKISNVKNFLLFRKNRRIDFERRFISNISAIYSSSSGIENNFIFIFYLFESD